jgi:hypothetical protein
LDRRRFLKYAGAGAVTVGASAAAYYVYEQPRAYSPSTSVSTLPSTTRTNRPPVVSAIKVRPAYINPTPEYMIELSYDGHDPDGDRLTTTWFIDGREVGRDAEYKTRLAEGEYYVQLQVSDKFNVEKRYRQVAVDPDQIYPEKSLYLRYKGVRYIVGPITPEWVVPSPSADQMNEQLDTIRNDLGCNAITIVGGTPSEDKMIECAKIAIEKRYERVYVQPSYVNATVDETISGVGEFAVRVKSLREISDAIVYMVGHEFQLETAIIRGENFWKRWENANKGVDLNKVAAVYPRMFKSIIDVCKRNYGYPISYAGTPWELDEDLIPWSSPAFESIGIDAYIHDFLGWNEDWMIALLNRLKRFRKPIHCADFGMMSYAGADKYGGWNPLYATQYPYDEEPQVRYTKRTLDMLNRARIDGCFWVQYNDDSFDRGHGLYHPQTLKRKKGFYFYKSYKPTGS